MGSENVNYRRPSFNVHGILILIVPRGFWSQIGLEILVFHTVLNSFDYF